MDRYPRVGWSMPAGNRISLFVALLVILAAGHSAADQVPIVAPLTSEGYLWAPPLNPLPDSRASFQFDFNYHQYDYRWFGNTEEITFSSYQLILKGEYTFLDLLTVGIDVPLLMVHNADSENDYVDSSGADFGNIRLHARYLALELPEWGLVFTPAFRFWLPTNTFLDIEYDILGGGKLDIIESFAVFEPILIVGWYMRPISVVFETGLKFVAVDDMDDFTFWSFDLVVGAAPIPSLEKLQFVLELNLMVELDDDDAISEPEVERVVPLAVSFGARYRVSSFELELAFRVGLHEAVIYYGDFNLGLIVSYLFGS